MNYNFIIFGGTGLQGRICARDLLESGYSVLLCGRDNSGIKDLLKNKKASFMQVDLRNFDDVVSAIRQSGAKIVVNCAELVFNVPIMMACLQTGKSVTDLGGLQKITKEQFKLDKQFKQRGILNITGCGSTPGIANVMAAYAVAQLDKIHTISLGFAWDSNIKQFVIPYSLQSIFEEFTAKPIAFHDRKFIREERIPMMGKIKFKGIGMQINYGIVHSEVYTFARYFKDKGIKNIHYFAGFPEHSMKVIRMLIDLGFNSEKEIEVNGVKIKSLDFAVAVLKRLKIPKGYKEVEDLWVKIEGIKQGKKHTSKMDCIIKTQEGWESAGSNIDTGRTISIMSQMLYNGLIKERGVHAPEGVIPCKGFFDELAKRKMWVYEDGRRVN